MREIGVVLTGVLIALGAEQSVQALHNQAEVRDLRRALDQELAWNLARMQDYSAILPCIDRRLDELDRWSRSVALGSPLKLTGPIDPPSSMIFRFSAWRSAAGSTIDHMPLDKRIAYARFYDSAESSDRMRVRTGELWENLAGLSGATTLTPSEARQASHDIRRIRRLSRTLANNHETWTKSYAAPLGIRAEDAPTPSASAKEIVEQSRADFCRPLLT